MAAFNYGTNRAGIELLRARMTRFGLTFFTPGEEHPPSWDNPALSKCDLSPDFGLRRFSVLANSRAKRRLHSRMLSYVTTTPRAVRMLSTSRRLRIKQ